MRPIPSKDRATLPRTLVGAASSLALMTAVIWTTIERRKVPTVQLETPNRTIVVEVTDAPAARSAGLSNRESLDRVNGLLLKWNTPGRHPIWMADMPFPLDLAWIDPNGRIFAVPQPCCHATGSHDCCTNLMERIAPLLFWTAGARAPPNYSEDDLAVLDASLHMYLTTYVSRCIIL
jgi:uncharacterized membrane protein (UPF0127 family)